MQLTPRSTGHACAGTLINDIALWTCDEAGQANWQAGWSASTRAPEPDDDEGLPGMSVTIPVLDEAGVQTAMVRLGISADLAQPAALEVWHNESEPPAPLSLQDAWYTRRAAAMAQQSSNTPLPWGVGLPGIAMEMQTAVYLGGLDRSELFQRAHSASQAGIFHGLAIPVEADASAVMLLSGTEQPIARRIEMVRVDGANPYCIGGYCQRDGDLYARIDGPPHGAQLLQAAIESRGPALFAHGESPEVTVQLAAMGAQALLVWPFFRGTSSPVWMAIWV